MTATWEKKEGNEGVLTVTVPAEKVNKALDQAFKKVVKQINVPGFRKGKVPRPIFEQRFGVEALYQDAVDILLPEAYGEAIEETEINPVAQPEVNVTQIEKGKDFIFEATVTVEPEVKLGDYKGLEIEKQETDLSDEELQESIDHSLSHLAEMVVKEDGAVENGDTVNIDFSGSVDGEEFDGGQAEGYDLEIGSGSFIPGFEEQIEGMKTGDEKDVVVTFPEEYHAEELAGKEATFKTKVNEIKFKDVPELNDEIANELDSDAENVDEYKENLRKRLSEQKATEAENTEKEDKEETSKEDLTEGFEDSKELLKKPAEVKAVKRADVKKITSSSKSETATNIRNEYFSKSNTVILTNSSTFVDSLSAVSLSRGNTPILFTNQSSLDSKTLANLKANKPKKVYILGGEKSVSNSVVNQLKSLGIIVERIAGHDRYEVNSKVAAKTHNPNTKQKTNILITSGENHSDAISSAILAQNKKAPILFVRKNEVPTSIKGYLLSLKRNNAIGSITIVGGNLSVSQQVESLSLIHI